jgi:hypothetical protein
VLQTWAFAPLPRAVALQTRAFAPRLSALGNKVSVPLWPKAQGDVRQAAQECRTTASALLGAAPHAPRRSTNRHAVPSSDRPCGSASPMTGPRGGPGT